MSLARSTLVVVRPLSLEGAAVVATRLDLVRCKGLDALAERGQSPSVAKTNRTGGFSSCHEHNAPPIGASRKLRRRHTRFLYSCWVYDVCSPPILGPLLVISYAAPVNQFSGVVMSTFLFGVDKTNLFVQIMPTHKGCDLCLGYPGKDDVSWR